MTDREALVRTYIQRQKDNSDVQERVKNNKLQIEEKRKTYEKTENYLKSIESIGQLVGEVIQKITEDKIMVKAASGPRYIVGCRPKIDKQKLKPGVRISLDMTTYNMLAEDPGDVKYSDVGGLTNQIRDIRETVELPLTNPELF